MSTLDIILLIPMLYFAYKGFRSGLVKEILGLIGIILAIFFTFKYLDVFTGVLSPFFEENSPYLPYASGVIIFLGTLIIIALIARLVSTLLDAVMLGTLNRTIGALFGILKIAVILSAILLLLEGFNIPSEETQKNSNLYPYVIKVGPWAYDSVSIIYPGAEDFKTTIEEIIEKYNPAENLPFINNDN